MRVQSTKKKADAFAKPRLRKFMADLFPKLLLSKNSVKRAEQYVVPWSISARSAGVISRELEPKNVPESENNPWG